VADIVANIAKGRIVEFHNRVKAGDPSTSRLFLIPIDAAAALTDDEFADSDDFAAVITAGATERTTSGWNRKTIAAADLTALAPDDTNNRFDVDMIDQTWTAVTAGAVTDLVLCYSSLTSPTNAQLIPLIMFDFAITPDGSDVVAQVNAAGYFRAS
jgi:hypothetical protein